MKWRSWVLTAQKRNFRSDRNKKNSNDGRNGCIQDHTHHVYVFVLEYLQFYIYTYTHTYIYIYFVWLDWYVYQYAPVWFAFFRCVCVFFRVTFVSESHGAILFAQATEQLHGGILQNLDIWKIWRLWWMMVLHPYQMAISCDKTHWNSVIVDYQLFLGGY